MAAEDGRYLTLASATDWLGRVAAVGDTSRDALVVSDLLASCEYEIDRVCGTVFIAKQIDALEVRNRNFRAERLAIPYAQSVASVSLDGAVLADWAQGGKIDVSSEDDGFSHLLRTGRRSWDVGTYILDGKFGYGGTETRENIPAEIVQAVKELVEFRYNTRQGIANITGAGDIVLDGGKPYPSSVYATLRAYKQVSSLVSVG